MQPPTTKSYPHPILYKFLDDKKDLIPFGTKSFLFMLLTNFDLGIIRKLPYNFFSNF